MEGKVYRGFTYDSSREYIVYMDDSTYPSTLVINFPNDGMPVRVEFDKRSGTSNSQGASADRGFFMIPAESHYDYERSWQLFHVNDKMLLSDGNFGDIVFLEYTEGFQWIKDNYVDLPDDIYGDPTFVNFDNKLYVVKLHKKYHKDKDSYKATIALWWSENGAVDYPKIIKDATYRDGGTYKATLEHNDETHDLLIPTRFNKTLKGRLDDNENGIVIRHDDPGYHDLWNDFKKASGLKLYHTISSSPDEPTTVE